ncbi:LOW QUALITY PROTEIN: hypothetical protein TorRG33x02_263710 [Trema orientale]|uniref:Uncharacterized protein n=1 Tax=Trema orientale TaxID=63057 RepID=A0A2P5D3A1_TREOI|nr:LOW QUALITY PROTEIN: hypothetical protein TorRG33x02_263710 [Trema orientale]
MILTFCVSELSINVRRKNPIILIMVIAIRFLSSNNDPLEPFHHTTSNETRYDHPHWKAVVRRQNVAVLHVRQYDIPRRVHGQLRPQARAVLGPTPAGQVLGPFEAHVEGPAPARHDAHPLEQGA